MDYRLFDGSSDRLPNGLPSDDPRLFFGRSDCGCSWLLCEDFNQAVATPDGRSHCFSPFDLFTKYGRFNLASINSSHPSGNGTQMHDLKPSVNASLSKFRPMKTI